MFFAKKFMLFHSLDFAFFLIIVFLIYWSLNKYLRIQNILILLASYVFYGWWSLKFLLLILFSTTLDYFIAIAIYKIRSQNSTQRVGLSKDKAGLHLLILSIVINLGILGFFKYYNFFIENFVALLSILGIHLNISSLNIILPIGISFYTFQTMSYTIDVYRGKLEPARDFVAFAGFVSFFPQLVAGPIERANDLLNQFYHKRNFDEQNAIIGLRQILWGLFKKVVIADNCAEFANHIFGHYNELNGSTLLLGAVFFAFQIYGDFSGYADIAVGTARLLGFRLMQNFASPYFSRDVAEFWRRWHISLSSWFRDYVYIPLGGSRVSVNKKIRNIFIIFILSGLWHGANWTFIFWGLLNAIYIYIYSALLQNGHEKKLPIVAHDRNLPTFQELFKIVITFLLICLSWVFFRSDNMHQAIIYLRRIFSSSLFQAPTLHKSLAPLSYFFIFFLCIEWLGRKNSFALEEIGLDWKPVFRYILHATLVFLVIVFSEKGQEFIYFQF